MLIFGLLYFFEDWINILSFFYEKFCFSDKNRTFASRLLSKFEKILGDSFRFSVRRGVSYVHFK